MMTGEEKKLDNPVWFSLDETHKDFSIDYGNLKCYDPCYCPFGGICNNINAANEIDEYAKINNDFFIVGEKPHFNIELQLKRELICLQMILHHPIDLQNQESIVKLNGIYEEALFHLVNLVQPGYFRSGTSRLGDYYGIIKNGSLVAAAGERMKMNRFTEVSAIVTHPEHRGKGYAKELIAHVVNKIFLQNKIPYLHVAETNFDAISLYEKLGFMTRRKISLWNFTKGI